VTKSGRAMRGTSCVNHEDVPSIARCASCDNALCGECFRFRMATRPACVRCAYEASTRPARRVSLAASFLAFAGVAGVWASRRYDLGAEAPWVILCGAVPTLAIAFVVAKSGTGAKGTVENREPDEDEIGELDLEGSANPYRAHVRRVVHAASPKISGSATALIVLGSFGGAGVLLPASVHLPRWLEAEIVLAIWWVIVATTLTTLLYRGFRLRDDYVYFVPWYRATLGCGGGNGRPRSGGGSGGLGWFDGCGDVSGLDGEGCVVAVVVGVVLAVAFGAAWIFVELVMPVVFLLMYWLFMRAISRAARDDRGCHGDFARSLGRACLWATVYVVPIAVLTWIAHVAHHRV